MEDRADAGKKSTLKYYKSGGPMTKKMRKTAGMREGVEKPGLGELGVERC